MDGNGTAPQGGQGFAPSSGNYPRGGFQGGPRGGGRGGLMFLGPYGSIALLVVLVVTYAVLAVSFWQFLKKAGLTPAIALLMLVPVVNIGVALWAAFTAWPVLAENARLKMLVATFQPAAAESHTPTMPSAATPPPMPGT